MSYNYELEAKKVNKIIDLAIISIRKFPPKNFDPTHVNHVIKVYEDLQKKALFPEPNYQNAKSLKYLKEDALIFFQESSGDAIEYFWKELKKEGLTEGISRINNLKKILKKGKISNERELELVTDLMIPYQQQGIITDDQYQLINDLIKEFEKKVGKS
jgi:hypothetical protein